jgi:hypothetical protein
MEEGEIEKVQRGKQTKTLQICTPKKSRKTEKIPKKRGSN